MSIRNLQPQALWNYFADLNAVPRASKKEERVIQFMIDFGNALGLETTSDAIGNVVIKKEATKGMENRKTVILQSHLDMVHQKNADTNFDFQTQGIPMLIDNDWVKANGTTLGADNGIGVAAIMAILASDTIAHPKIEALFTIDEETGMTGAIKLDPTNLSGQILLNLDTEDDDELSIGCAGGIDTNTKYTYQQSPIQPNSLLFSIKIRGLLGGHSGMDIHKGRANANLLMNRLLYHIYQLNNDLQLISIDGGSLRNAIPRESFAIVALPRATAQESEKKMHEFARVLQQEYQAIEQNLSITIETLDNHEAKNEKAVSPSDLMKIVNVLHAVPNGVFRMSPDIDDLVETSSSLARVIVANGEFITQSLQRSSVESTKTNVANTIRAVFELADMNVIQNGEYPGWKPNPNSEILNLMHKLYVDRFHEQPQIKACHAGLECGILGTHLPNTDMISFGPNIRAAHSPDEKVQISSVQKFWEYLLDVLKNTPTA